jgi:2-desacetyl-2-hydroxyethyl bacteriochlorophyllide A dehydrogenase
MKMRAAVLAAPRRITISEVSLPEPKPNEVFVRLQGCGICASNLPPWEGRPWFTYPMPPGTPGHEGWGAIERTGSDVKQFQSGDRVGMLSFHAFAQYDVADQNAVVKLPDSLKALAFPAEPIGCAINVFRRAGISKESTVAIIGVGFLGALVIRLAAQTGARVIAISRRKKGLQIGQEFGATHCLVMEDHWHIVNTVKAITNERFCDVVVEATGKQWPLDLAGEITAERGRLVIAGYHQDGLRQVNMQLWNWRGLDVINAHERDPGIYRQGMQTAVDSIASGRLDPTPLYTHSYPFDRIEDAFETAASRPDDFMKALVMF